MPGRKKQLSSAMLFTYTSSFPPLFPKKKKFFTVGVSLRKIFRSLKLLLTSFFAPRTWLVKCWLAAYAQSTPILQENTYIRYLFITVNPDTEQKKLYTVKINTCIN